jgi:hypothetical protein
MLKKFFGMTLLAGSVLVLSTTGVVLSTSVGVIALAAVSDAAAKTCPRPRKAKSKVGECLRKAGAPYGVNPSTGNCSFWTKDRALSDKCGATWR